MKVPFNAKLGINLPSILYVSIQNDGIAKKLTFFDLKPSYRLYSLIKQISKEKKGRSVNTVNNNNTNKTIVKNTFIGNY